MCVVQSAQSNCLKPSCNCQFYYKHMGGICQYTVNCSCYASYACTHLPCITILFPSLQLILPESLAEIDRTCHECADAHDETSLIVRILIKEIWLSIPLQLIFIPINRRISFACPHDKLLRHPPHPSHPLAVTSSL